jgi:hypothetical protein
MRCRGAKLSTESGTTENLLGSPLSIPNWPISVSWGQRSSLL